MAYGDESDQQFGELSLPASDTIRGIVVLLHGGAWSSEWDLTTLARVAGGLVAAGYAVWNLEYRRVGNGGGPETTFLDVARGVDHLVELAVSNRMLRQAMPDRVCFLGYSSGAQLAVWAASRTAATPGGAPAYEPAAVVSVAGPLAMSALSGQQNLLGRSIRSLLGGTADQVPAAYQQTDPILLVPAPCPIIALHGVDDSTVPFQASQQYAVAAVRAGGRATFVPMQAPHVAIASTTGPIWGRVLDSIGDALQG